VIDTLDESILLFHTNKMLATPTIAVVAIVALLSLLLDGQKGGAHAQGFFTKLFFVINLLFN